MKTCIFWPSVLRIVNIVNLGQLPDAVSNYFYSIIFPWQQRFVTSQ